MSINREVLKRMIEIIHEDDAAEVYDFIGYLNMKRNREDSLNVELLSVDKKLIHQIDQSRDDREKGRVFDRNQGLEYLKNKVDEFERGQNL